MTKIYKILPIINLFLLSSCQNTVKPYIREYKYATVAYSIDKGEQEYVYTKSFTLDDDLFKETSNYLHNFLNNDKNCVNYVSAGGKFVDIYTIIFYYDLTSDGFKNEYFDSIIISKEKSKLTGVIHDYTNYDYSSSTKNLNGSTLEETLDLLAKYDKILDKLEYEKSEWHC